jgi:hypothetical protein
MYAPPTTAPIRYRGSRSRRNRRTTRFRALQAMIYRLAPSTGY